MLPFDRKAVRPLRENCPSSPERPDPPPHPARISVRATENKKGNRGKILIGKNLSLIHI